MDRERGSRRTVTAAVAALAVAASLAAMFWIWRSGGAPFGVSAVRSAAVEECGMRFSGASSMAIELAPAIVGDFLRRSGYDVGAPQTLPDGVIRVEGQRGEVRCTVTIRAVESTTGFQDLVSGDAAVALALRPVLPGEIEALKRASAGDFHAERALAEHVVAYGAIAAVVHRSNRVTRLDTDEVGAIYTGYLPNWAHVGGADSRINMYASLERSGGDDFPNDLVPSEEAPWTNAVKLATMHVERNDRAVIDGVARDPVGIGFVSGSSVRGLSGVRVLSISAGGSYTAPTVSAMRAQAYPLTHRIFLYVRPRDMRENAFVRGFVDYFKSPAAFDRIEELGFAALRENAAEDASAMRAMGCIIGTPETATIVSTLRGAEKSDTVLRFRPNTGELDDPSRAGVTRLSPELIDRITKGWHIVLIGHSDAGGGLTKNRELALDRALSARAAFEARGVFGLQVESAGENCPIADMDSTEGRRVNRRVEIWLRPPQQARAAASR